MRTLLIAILLAAGAWSGWWLYGSSLREAAYEDWFEDRRAEGWVAEYGALQVQGFPNRFDVMIDDVELADPEAGWAWTAPFLHVLGLSYDAEHVIIVWPEMQTLATPTGKIRIGARDMRASLVVAGDSQTLERATLVAEGLSVLPEGGETWDAGKLTLAVARQEVPEARYRIGLSADGVAPVLRSRVRVASDLVPETIKVLRADLDVTFDHGWGRDAVEGERPQPREIDLALAEAKWGKLHLQAAGKLAIDPEGVADGRITVKARNWRDILELIRASGHVPDSLLDPLGDALGFLARLSGNPRTLDLPFDLDDGRISLGPIPLGRAPRLQLR